MSRGCDKLGFIEHYVRTNQAVVSSTFSKVAPARRERITAFLFENFFFAPMLSKKKWIKDFLIAKPYSRFSLEKEAQRKANKRKGRMWSYALHTAPTFLKKVG